MLEHINNILSDIDLLLKDDNLKFDNEKINIVKDYLKLFKKMLENKDDESLIDLTKVKEISNVIYDLNIENLFSILTDHMSNELYAFEYLLQEKIKMKEV